MLTKYYGNENGSIPLMDLLLVPLPMLKVLKLTNVFDSRLLQEQFHSENIKRVKFPLLEKLKLTLRLHKYHERILQIIDCENLKKLYLQCVYVEKSPIKMLTSLHLLNIRVEMFHIQKMAEHFPNLTKFGITLSEIESNFYRIIIDIKRSNLYI